MDSDSACVTSGLSFRAHGLWFMGLLCSKAGQTLCFCIALLYGRL